jgi:hypothetical protein
VRGVWHVIVCYGVVLHVDEVVERPERVRKVLYPIATKNYLYSLCCAPRTCPGVAHKSLCRRFAIVFAYILFYLVNQRYFQVNVDVTRQINAYKGSIQVILLDNTLTKRRDYIPNLFSTALRLGAILRCILARLSSQSLTSPRRLISWRAHAPAFRMLVRRTGIPGALSMLGASGQGDRTRDHPGGIEGSASFQPVR